MRLSLLRWLLQASSKRPELKFKHCNCRPVGIAPQGGFLRRLPVQLRPSAGRAGDRNAEKAGCCGKTEREENNCKFFWKNC